MTVKVYSQNQLIASDSREASTLVLRQNPKKDDQGLAVITEPDKKRPYDNCFTVDLARYGSKGQLHFVCSFLQSKDFPDYSRITDIRKQLKDEQLEI